MIDSLIMGGGSKVQFRRKINLYGFPTFGLLRDDLGLPFGQEAQVVKTEYVPGE